MVHCHGARRAILCRNIIIPKPPPQTGLYASDGSLISWISDNALDADHPYHSFLPDHVTPEFGVLSADDGQILHYSLLKPPGFDARKCYPVIVEVYGGPHVQTVTRSWGSLSDQYLARQGYLIFRLDNRGSWNRGKKFEDVIHRRTGLHEVSDQMMGVDWLKTQPFVDPGRIAIQGWSYGGYMTLMTILQAPADTFACAVAELRLQTGASMIHSTRSGIWGHHKQPRRL